MLAAARELSDALFESKYRLEVVAAIGRLRSATFTTPELKALLDDPLAHDNNAGRHLKRLSESCLIEKVDEGLWHRNPSPLWAFCAKWLNELLERDADALRNSGMER